MKALNIRNSILAAAIGFAMTGCGGHALVPSQNVPGASFNAIPAVKNACDIRGLWDFDGACTTAVLTSKGGTAALKPYKHIGVTLDLGANNATAKVHFVIGDATDKGDITGKERRKPFPPYSNKTCSAKNSCPGTPLIYIEAINLSKTKIQFHTDSKLIVTAKTFPGKKCGPGLLSTKGWVSYITILNAAPKGGKVTLTILPVPQFNLPPGPAYVAFACM
jgi:hypothetical protein